jgi:hypothetical protein
MPDVIVSPPPVDARISGLSPDPEPAPPLRITLGPISEDDELIYMRSVLRHYVRRFGADVVRQAVEQLARGAR